MNPEPDMGIGQSFGVACGAVHRAVAAGLLAGLVAAGPSRLFAQDEAASGPGGVARARFLMGTRLAVETEGRAPAGAVDAALDEVARLERIFSNWRRESEVSRLNEEAARAPVRCSRELFGAVRSALGWAKETGGAFDPTVEPLVRALGLRGDEGRLPDPEGPAASVGDATIPSAPAPIGWRHVHLRHRTHSVRFDTEGVGLDLGGIGKGIALDAAAGVLRRHGVRRALLDFGGQVLAIGHPVRFPAWSIGIADPEDRDKVIAVVGIDGLSLATSSNSERFVETPGGRIGHILDPAAGRPAHFQGSLTVAARDATSADALSTALFVMGPDRGSAWAEARHIPALYVWRDETGTLRSKSSHAFEERFGIGGSREGDPGWGERAGRASESRQEAW